MAKVEIFEPAMCCFSGVCGPDVDPQLVRFAADLAWLKEQGVNVERYNLAQRPEKFVESPLVQNAMSLAGELCLPIVLVDGKIFCQNRYPARDELADWTGVEKNGE